VVSPGRGRKTGRNAGSVLKDRRALRASQLSHVARTSYAAKVENMFLRVFRIMVGLGAAIWVAAAVPAPTGMAFAQSGGAPKAAEKPPASGPAAAQKTEEYADIQHAMTGPAGNPECAWLGRRVISLLWRDDIETAFRHLDLYDRFGCPAAHIPATFRCLILQTNTIDPKAPDSLNNRVTACWINPLEPAPPPPAAAAAAPQNATSKH
jgi:hypothetical protein